ncbi:MAG: YkvA family protein [Myxococcota bacterium]
MKDWWNALESAQKWLIGSVAASWAALLIYVVSPIDFIVDIIPVLGQLDDLAMMVSTVLFTVYAYRKIRAETGFSGLVPDSLKPRGVHTTAPLTPSPDEPYEARLDGDGDDMGIDGYRPLSYEQIQGM